jgi:hypothetical protein
VFISAKERIDRVSNPVKGKWRPFGHTAILGCPSCGFAVSLMQYDILPTGVVLPTVHCPAYRCRFYTAVTLDGWDATRNPTDPESAFAGLDELPAIGLPDRDA